MLVRISQSDTKTRLKRLWAVRRITPVAIKKDICMDNFRNIYAENKKIKEKINCKIAFIFNKRGK